jgi:hypothetical protein
MRGEAIRQRENVSKNTNEPRPKALKVLIATEGIFAFAGLMSGYGLLSSPSGKWTGLSLDLLKNTPIGDFALVGLFFVAFYGVLPALAAWALDSEEVALD